MTEALEIRTGKSLKASRNVRIESTTAVRLQNNEALSLSHNNLLYLMLCEVHAV